jgi:hypothetical protein
MKKQFVVSLAIGIGLLSVAGTAMSSVTENLSETFQSGAQFSGQLTFSDNTYSDITGVTGILSGGSYGSDSINWVWYRNEYGENSALLGTNTSGYAVYADFLMDGTFPSYDKFIETDWYYNGSYLFLDNSFGSANTGLPANAINYQDQVVSYQFSEGSAATPEPATMFLFGTGLAGLAGFVRRKKS